MYNNCIVYIIRQTKLILEFIFFFAKVLFFLNFCLDKDCLQLVALFKIMLCCKRYCIKIIKSIIKLINAILSNALFTIYDYKSYLYQLNVVAFLKDIRSTNYYQIEIVYYLATKQIVDNASSRYIVECNLQSSRSRFQIIYCVFNPMLRFY